MATSGSVGICPRVRLNGYKTVMESIDTGGPYCTATFGILFHLGGGCRHLWARDDIASIALPYQDPCAGLSDTFCPLLPPNKAFCCPISRPVGGAEMHLRRKPRPRGVIS
jgi:hypothetical protein